MYPIWNMYANLYQNCHSSFDKFLSSRICESALFVTCKQKMVYVVQWHINSKPSGLYVQLASC